MDIYYADGSYDFKSGSLLPELSIFLAGGITNCPDWQKDMIALLETSKLCCDEFVIFNPRYKLFDPLVFSLLDQVRWEFKHLCDATIILFWFPKESVCPIALFELGKWLSHLDKPIFIGAEKGYPRMEDLHCQVYLERPELKIVTSLEELANQVIEAAGKETKSSTITHVAHCGYPDV